MCVYIYIFNIYSIYIYTHTHTHTHTRTFVKSTYRDFPGGAVVKNPPANAGVAGSSPGLGRSHMLQST